jgi:hypothetical protein
VLIIAFSRDPQPIFAVDALDPEFYAFDLRDRVRFADVPNDGPGPTAALVTSESVVTPPCVSDAPCVLPISSTRGVSPELSNSLACADTASTTSSNVGWFRPRRVLMRSPLLRDRRWLRAVAGWRQLVTTHRK